MVTDAVEKADALNDFFASVFTREDELSIPTPVSYFSGSDTSYSISVLIHKTSQTNSVN